MTSITPNNLYTQIAKNAICTALGVRLVTSPAIVQIASSAGYHSLFIDLEHSTLSIKNAGSLCTTALLAGITPFVRVPHQCGNGFIQRVLDGGAMGVIVPHVNSADDARAAVSICKYPPQGVRSVTGQLPQFRFRPTPMQIMIEESNATGSTLFLMLEMREGVENIESIAQVQGVDVLLVGSNDLSVELGVPGQFGSDVFKSALLRISQAAKRHGKILGLAGIYENIEYARFVVNELGAKYLLLQQDSALLGKGARACIQTLHEL